MGPWLIFSSFGMLEFQCNYGDSSQRIDIRKDGYWHLLGSFSALYFDTMFIVWYNILNVDGGRGVVRGINAENIRRSSHFLRHRLGVRALQHCMLSKNDVENILLLGE